MSAFQSPPQPPVGRSRTHFSDRMSESDALMWTIESDPALRSTIVCLWVLDRSPDPLRFQHKLEQVARAVPRLRQRPVSDALRLAPPSWEEDPNFDLAFHLRRAHAPGDGSLRALVDAAQPIGMQAFDRDRPLWELHLFEGLEGGRAGVVLKLHHAISDGVGLVRMTEGLIERTREPEAGESRDADDAREARERRRPWVRAEAPTALDRTRRAGAARIRSGAVRAGRVARALQSTLADLVRHPVETVQKAAEGVRSLGRLLTPVTEPMSPLMRGRSLSSRYDVVFLPLDQLKRAGRSVGGTVNDAFVAGVTGGLRLYHESQGAPVEELRMNMPINMREGDKSRDAGNQFVPVRFAVPVGIRHPGERMLEIRRRVAAQRAESALPLMEEISSLIGALPGEGPARFAGLLMKSIDFTTSNVPGPRFPVFMSGARIEHMFGFGPLAGAAINVTCFSYDGELAVGVNADPAAVSEPQLFVECLRKGFDEVVSGA